MDLTKILKVGNKIYSTLIGDCFVVAIDDTGPFKIRVRAVNGGEYIFDKEGRYYTKLSECLLFPSKENRDWSTWEQKKECSFKPFDKVLVRNTANGLWFAEFFSSKYDKIFYCIGANYTQCIPYNKETQHLVDTNQDCPDKYKIW